MDIEGIIYEFNHILREVNKLETTELGDLVSEIRHIGFMLEDLRDTTEDVFGEKEEDQ